MHAILARPSDDAAFAPEPMTAEDCTALGRADHGQLDGALGLLRDAGRCRCTRAMLIERRDRAIDRGDPCGDAQGAGDGRTRIHGDLHLGQMLVTGSDVMMIDFEGEPARPLAERRGKDLALRDVAGVLRSFDYASAVARRSAAGRRRYRGGADQRALRRVPRSHAAALFLSGYSGRPTMRTIDPLLDVFLLEKAAYEVAYEAANRPDWIGVPVSGLARAAGRLLNRESGMMPYDDNLSALTAR